MLALLLITIINMYVIDACSLIYITKINCKEKLATLGTFFIGDEVEKELLHGLERFPDAQTISNNINRKKILILNTEDIVISKIFDKLGPGEAETIQIAVEKGFQLVTDDQEAIKLAISQGLKPKTSEILLLMLLESEKINYGQFISNFNKLAKIKLLKTDVVEFFTKKAEEIRKKQRN